MMACHRDNNDMFANSAPSSWEKSTDCHNHRAVNSAGSVEEKFGDLVCDVATQLEKNGVTLPDIAFELGIDLNNPEYQIDGKRINNISDFMLYLSTTNHMPFYCPDMLETIISNFAEEHQQAMKEYKTNYLEPFLQKVLPDIAKDWCFHYDKKADQVTLTIKVSRQYSETRLLDVLQLTKKVASIIEIPHEQLVIEAVEQGSVIVVYRIPHGSAITSLTSSQKQDLVKLSVKQMECGGMALLDCDIVDATKTSTMTSGASRLTESIDKDDIQVDENCCPMLKKFLHSHCVVDLETTRVYELTVPKITTCEVLSECEPGTTYTGKWYIIISENDTCDNEDDNGFSVCEKALESKGLVFALNSGGKFDCRIFTVIQLNSGGKFDCIFVIPKGYTFFSFLELPSTEEYAHFWITITENLKKKRDLGCTVSYAYTSCKNVV